MVELSNDLDDSENASESNLTTWLGILSFTCLASFTIFRNLVSIFFEELRYWYEFTGKQGPPTPGPGKCGWKLYFSFAASITAYVSIPNFSNNNANSFTKAILISRNTLVVSLTAFAVLQLGISTSSTEKTKL